MALYNDVRPIIAGQFNKQYKTDLTFDQLKIEDLANNEIPDMLKYNTVITVSGAGKEPLAVFYNRYPISDVVDTKQTLLMPSKNNDSVHAMLPTLNKRFGLDLSVTEVEDAPIDLAIGDVTVVIKDSINFIAGSSFTFKLDFNTGTVYNGVPVFCQTLYNNGRMRADIYQLNCSDANYPEYMYGTKSSFPGLVTANVDYTPIAYILRNVGISEQWYVDNRVHYEPGGTLGHVFAAMRTIDGNPYVNDWFNSAGNQFGVYCWMPIYNGPTKDCRGLACRLAQVDMTQWLDTSERLAAIDLVNTDYDNVLIMRPSPYGRNLGLKMTHMICHYNGVF